MTNDSAPANAYLRTRVLTASPEQLRMMLLEGAVRFARQARQGIDDADYELSFTGFTQCRAIILELINSTRPDVDPELCRRVSSLYTFIYSRLIDASRDRSVEILDEAIGLLEYECETWRLVMDRLAAERGSGKAPTTHAAEAGAYRPLSVQG